MGYTKPEPYSFWKRFFETRHAAVTGGRLPAFYAVGGIPPLTLQVVNGP